MLWLYILLGVLLVFALILALPIKLKAARKKELSAALYIGFVKIPILPAKPKKKKKKKKKKKPDSAGNQKKSEKKKPNIVRELGLSRFVEFLTEAAKLAAGVLKELFGHIIIGKMLVSIKVSEEDAAQTAVLYGRLCSAVYPAVGIIAGNTKCRKYGVDISPDFESSSGSDYRLELEAKITVGWIIYTVLKHGGAVLDIFSKLKEPLIK